MRREMTASSSPPHVGSLRTQVLSTMSRSALARDLYSGLSRLPIVGSLMRGAAERVLPVGERVWVQIPKGPAQGLWLQVDARFEPHFLDGQYEWQAQEVLLEHLRHGCCFYDVGAHVGFFSLLAARIVGGSGLVVAFEPDPQNAEILREAAQRNRMPQLRVVEAAVWSSSGPIEFQRAHAASGRVDGQVGPVANWRDDDRVCVDGVSLDDFVLRGEAPPPDFLKVDIEAAESEALKGASRLFDTFAPLLLCEVHNVSNEAAIREWLAQRRYQFKRLQGPGSFPVHLLGFPNGQTRK